MIQNEWDGKNENCELKIGRILVFINPHWQGQDLAVQENNGQIVNLDPEQLRQSLASLGLIVNENGILEVQKIKAKTATLEQIEMKDKATGQIYCTWIEQGEWVKVQGECSSQNNNNSPSPNPAPEPEPQSEPTAEPQLETLSADSGDTGTIEQTAIVEPATQ